jgi:hypothetical protein
MRRNPQRGPCIAQRRRQPLLRFILPPRSHWPAIEPDTPVDEVQIKSSVIEPIAEMETGTHSRSSRFQPTGGERLAVDRLNLP